MDLGIAGKIAFVGGSSKGMGLATARLLGADGCKVAIVAREPNSLEKAVNELRENGGEAMGISAGLATRDRARRMKELGSVAAFLASDLGGYITGHWFAVDGGRHAFSF